MVVQTTDEDLVRTVGNGAGNDSQLGQVELGQGVGIHVRSQRGVVVVGTLHLDLAPTEDVDVIECHAGRGHFHRLKLDERKATLLVDIHVEDGIVNGIGPGMAESPGDGVMKEAAELVVSDTIL